jgi:hypothetical protein
MVLMSSEVEPTATCFSRESDIVSDYRQKQSGLKSGKCRFVFLLMKDGENAPTMKTAPDPCGHGAFARMPFRRFA